MSLIFAKKGEEQAQSCDIASYQKVTWQELDENQRRAVKATDGFTRRTAHSCSGVLYKSTLALAAENTAPC